MPETTVSSVASIAVGRVVREARLGVGMTQREMAARLGGSAPYISALEHGRVNPTIGQVFAIASALGLEFNMSLTQPELVPEPTIPPPRTERLD